MEAEVGVGDRNAPLAGVRVEGEEEREEVRSIAGALSSGGPTTPPAPPSSGLQVKPLPGNYTQEKQRTKNSVVYTEIRTASDGIYIMIPEFRSDVSA